MQPEHRGYSWKTRLLELPGCQMNLAALSTGENLLGRSRAGWRLRSQVEEHKKEGNQKKNMLKAPKPSTPETLTPKLVEQGDTFSGLKSIITDVNEYAKSKTNVHGPIKIGLTKALKELEKIEKQGKEEHITKLKKEVDDQVRDCQSTLKSIEDIAKHAQKLKVLVTQLKEMHKMGDNKNNSYERGIKYYEYYNEVREKARRRVQGHLI
ncbi:hypothetical protein TSAR_011221 [Trichomalopsis sarcophagae]|uniref:Uncharacterized protein n=1 Tax=Trichomalopsis sarcophagae TaxID=543379 RepID=A0A232FHU8_9HYME|nr:hypothetical protein TSAR_011221 [Trichomalopsis sarcophagae]